MKVKTWASQILLLVAAIGQAVGQYSSYDFNAMCGGGLVFSNMGAIFINTDFEMRSKLNCTVSIQTGKTRQFMVKFQRLRMSDDYPCQDNILDLYDGKVNRDNSLTGGDGLCGSDTPTQTYFTEGNLLNIQVIAKFALHDQQFKMMITDNTWDFSCNYDGFVCNDGRCIDRFLKCDEWENCADGSDEDCGGGGGDEGDDLFWTPWVIGGISVAGLLVLGVILAIMTVSIKRLRPTRKEKYINFK